MEARIGSEGVGSVEHEKEITDALNAIEGVKEVKIANGAIYIIYDALKTTEKRIEESIRASGNSVTSAITGTEAPSLDTAASLEGSDQPS